MSSPDSSEDLFFDKLVQGYVDKNPRFLRRDWLATKLDEKLKEPGRRFVLLTAEPGAGKSAFMAQLAHDHPDWLRYFIRRDQRESLKDASTRSLLLRIGYQLSARHPKLFSQKQLQVSVSQRIGQVADGGVAVGAEVKRLTASPFYLKILEIEQHVQANQGKVVGLRIMELVIEERLLSPADLLHLALVDPARALMQVDPCKQIVILIDALDEISYQKEPGDILAWLTKCPELPENIRFVLTSRPPNESLRVFCNGQMSRLSQLTIAEDDPSVQADIKHFVNQWVEESTVSQAITEVKGSTEGFVQKATDKAHGNLGYLDALARGVDRAITDLASKDVETNQRGRRMLDALLSLKELPDDQSGLYSFFLNQIKTSVARERIEQRDSQTGETYDKAVWPAVYAPMLGVLAVAMEPVDLDLIMRLGSIRAERDWVSDALDRLRQFLDHIDGHYRLYHATVAEFLTAGKTRVNPDTTALYQDPLQRHRQIGDHYWQFRNDWSKCDGYGLRNLAAHLDSADEVDRLHELITNAWMQARVRGDGYRYSGFIADLMRAWERARTEAVRQIETNDAEFATFAICFRYALIRTSINSLSMNYPPELITRALDTKVWTSERALDICAHQPNGEQRAKMYRAVLKADRTMLSDMPCHHIERAALSAAEAIKEDSARAEALTALAPQLSGMQKSQALDKAIAAAKSVVDNGDRARALAALAPQLRGRQKSQAVRNALALVQMMQEDEKSRAQALAMLVPHLRLVRKAQVLDDALTRVLQIEAENDRAWALLALAKQLRGKQIEAALGAVRPTTDDRVRALLLHELAPQLHGEQLTAALKSAQMINNDGDRIWAMAVLASRLSGWHKAHMLDDVLSLAVEIEDGFERVEVLVALASHLRGERKIQIVDQALAATLGIEDSEVLTRALDLLAPLLIGPQIGVALTAALRIKTTCDRAQAMAALAPRLNEEQVTAAVAAVIPIEDAEDRIKTLAVLATRLRGGRKARVLNVALGAVETITDDGVRAQLLGELAPQLHGEQLTTALKAAQMINNDGAQAELLATLVPQLRGARKAKALNAALAKVSAIEDEVDLVKTLTILASQLRGAQKTHALNKAIAAARTIAENGYQAQALAALAPQLSREKKTQALRNAIALTQMIEEDDELNRCRALAMLAPQLRREQKTRVLNAALARMLAIEDKGSMDWAWAMAELAPRLEGSQVETALAAGLDLKEEWCRANVFKALATQLSGVQIEVALAATLMIENDEGRAEVLASLAPQLNGGQITAALAAATAIKDATNRLKILLALPDSLKKPYILQNIRRCLLEYLGQGLANKTRSELLDSTLWENAVHPRIAVSEPIAAIAQYTMEISEWRWV